MQTSLITPLTRPVVLSGWAFIPGPEQMDKPENSQFANAISEHSAKSIAASILDFAGTELIHPANPSWYQWQARWHDGNRFIDLDLTLFDDEETWGGSEIEADCLAGDIIEFWSFLQTRHNGVWLHAPSCIMHTQQSFLKGLIAAEAEQSWADLDSGHTVSSPECWNAGRPGALGTDSRKDHGENAAIPRSPQSGVADY